MRYTLSLLLPVLFFVLPVFAEEADRIPLKIGKDTTYFTGPVNEDGIIDYVAALNKHYGEGIKNEDNAFALMVQLLPYHQDLTDDQRTHQKRLYEVLGLDLQADVPRVQHWDDFAEAHGLSEARADELFDQVFDPWLAKDFPLVSKWISENEPAMALLSQALERETYFSPLIRVEDDEPAIAVLLPQLSYQRQLGRLFAIRAWRDFQAGDDKAVIDTLLLFHRMGKAISNEPFLIGKLVGISIQGLQISLVEAIAERGFLSHELAQVYIREQRKTGPIDSMLEAISVMERCLSLDTLMRSWVGKGSGLAFFMELEGGKKTPASELYYQRVELLCQSPYFDINIALRSLNTQFDRQHEMSQIRDRKAFGDAEAAFGKRLDDAAPGKLVLQLMRLSVAEELPEDWSVQKYSESVGNVYARMLMPALGASLRTQNRSNARRLVDATAIALLGYRDQHGVLPDSLDALVPVYFDAVPIDFATDKPLIYRVNEDGSALVYSIGDNFKDDGGVDDYKIGDIAIRIGTGKP